MSPMPPSSSFAPVATGGPNEHSIPPRQAFRLVFWPILLGAILISLIWGFWKFKAAFWTSESPVSSPKPSTSAAVRMARVRGAPIVGRPLATVSSKSSIIDPPPPVYICPPRYDEVQPPYGEGTSPV